MHKFNLSIHKLAAGLAATQRRIARANAHSLIRRAEPLGAQGLLLGSESIIFDVLVVVRSAVRCWRARCLVCGVHLVSSSQ